MSDVLEGASRPAVTHRNAARHRLRSQPTFESQRVVVQAANHIPGFARQQPGLEANKRDRAGRIYHRPRVLPVCALSPEGISSATTGAGCAFARWIKVAMFSRGALCSPVPRSPSIMREISCGRGYLRREWFHRRSTTHHARRWLLPAALSRSRGPAA